MINSPTVALAMDLVSRPSVTPFDAGCQDLMIDRLESCGFKVERLKFDDVDNFGQFMAVTDLFSVSQVTLMWSLQAP